MTDPHAITTHEQLQSRYAQPRELVDARHDDEELAPRVSATLY